MPRLDHIMYATPDLDQGIAEIAKLTGVTPAFGGAHPGGGTRNALLSLGREQYLEIIAPDPDQDVSGTLGEELIRRGSQGVRSWAVASPDLSAVAAIAKRLSMSTRPVVPMSRTTPEGVRLDWELLFLTGAAATMPFFIDWKQSPHPAANTPTGCELVEFMVYADDDGETAAWVEAFQLDVSVGRGASGLGARIQTPKGLVSLPAW